MNPLPFPVPTIDRVLQLLARPAARLAPTGKSPALTILHEVCLGPDASLLVFKAGFPARFVAQNHLTVRDWIMNIFVRKLLSATVITVAVAGIAGTAFADTTWQKNHPRREQVNNRLANQNKRIHQDVKNGTLTKGQAAALHKDDRQVRQEERDMASQNGSHITKPEQKVLNQQENAISKEIPPK